MDAEKGRQPNPERPNTFRVQIKQSKVLGLQGLQAYMLGKADFTVECLEAITFLDHLMREFPSRNLISIKRSFFHKDLEINAGLGAGVIAAKGVYQSIRPGQGGLVVNVDVANQCFWEENTLYSICLALALPNREHEVILKMQKPAPGRESMVYKNLQRLKKVRFMVDYRNISDKQKRKVFVVDQILRVNARDARFKAVDRKTGEEKDVSVLQYFWDTYKVRLEYPHMPLVQAVGKNKPMFPLELCNVVKGQKYPFKLSDVQTSSMIKFAVTRPGERAAAIAGGRSMLNWGADPILSGFGLKINPDMMQTKAKLLTAPRVEFGLRQAETPGTSGRWRTDGKQFVQPPPAGLHVFSVMIFNDWGSPRDKVTPTEVTRFVGDFLRLFKAHGGKVLKDRPAAQAEGNAQAIPESVAKLWNQTRTATQGLEPQIMLFIVNGKVSHLYNRLKRQCDNRFGCVSQVMQSAHVKKAQGQYISNVLLKVFAKLGGFGFRALPADGTLGTPYPWFNVPTMIVGADVSHGGPGSSQASIASMTVSMDRVGMRYWAGVHTNGRRTEMISSWNIFDMLEPVFREWMSTVGGGVFPKHLIYFRDGVSEGQYQHVLQQEVRDMKAVWEMLDQTPDKRAFKALKFTVVVASKRHHIRFFPSGAGAQDRNGNAHPGTLVERDVTHPREYDFYLAAHSAIQGTARPVHYQVLMDEANMPVDKFVKLVYNHSYQYVRSTTPVSIFPAIYYAHLAAKRAVAHDRNFGEDDADFTPSSSDRKDLVLLEEAKAAADRTGKIMTKTARDRLAAIERRETPTLIPLGPPVPEPEKGTDPRQPAQGPNPDKRRFKWTMWFC
jgi:eukaryotic translation initiation factor 2C